MFDFIFEILAILWEGFLKEKGSKELNKNKAKTNKVVKTIIYNIIGIIGLFIIILILWLFLFR